MRHLHLTTLRTQRGSSPLADELSALFETIDDTEILAVLTRYRWTGRRGWSLRALWRGYLAGFVLNIPTTNALIRRLQDDPALRDVCGFEDDLPSRWTFNRFISRLSHHPDVLEQVLADLTSRLHELLPDFGKGLALDATTVRSYSNPNKRQISDAEASWTAKTGTKGKREWFWGYKLHLVVDAHYELPIAATVTTASVHDSKQFSPVLEKARTTHPWFRPAWVAADAGYDGTRNYEYVVDMLQAVPIIKINRRTTRKPEDALRYVDQDGAPRCMGGERMAFLGHSDSGRLRYACPSEGCHLKDRHADMGCNSYVEIDPTVNPRKYAFIPRESAEWKTLYRKRQSVERCFSRLKGHRTLNAHARRGLRKVQLHVLMSVLTLQADALAKAEAGSVENVRHCTRKVA